MALPNKIRFLDKLRMNLKEKLKPSQYLPYTCSFSLLKVVKSRK